MHMENYMTKSPFLLKSEIKELMAQNKRNADVWEETQRAKRPITNANGLLLKNRINAQRWYGNQK